MRFTLVRFLVPFVGLLLLGISGASYAQSCGYPPAAEGDYNYSPGGNTSSAGFLSWNIQNIAGLRQVVVAQIYLSNTTAVPYGPLPSGASIQFTSRGTYITNLPVSGTIGILLPAGTYTFELDGYFEGSQQCGGANLHELIEAQGTITQPTVP